MKEKEEEKVFPKVRLNWYPGHMAKTKREIQEDLKLIDVVIEILDARIPLSSQNPDMKDMIKKKKKIIILNKYDLADEKETKKWKEYFEKQNQATVLVNSNSGKGIDEVIKTIQDIMADELASYEEKGRTGKIIRVLILGIPNVGKSSFINRASKKTSAQVRKQARCYKEKTMDKNCKKYRFVRHSRSTLAKIPKSRSCT